MSTQHRRLTAGALAAILLALPGAAFAQETEAADLAAQGQADAKRSVTVASSAGRIALRTQEQRKSTPLAHALASGTDVIDYNQLIRDVFEDAARRRNALQGSEPGEKQKLEAQKRQYVADSKNAKNAKRDAENALRAWQKSEKDRIKAIKDKGARDGADRAFKAEERNRKLAVNHAERDAQARAKTTWQTAQKAYKAFQEELKNARFEAKSMPRYEKDLKPHLLSALKALNEQLKKTTDDAANAGAGGISVAVIANLRPDIVRGYIRYMIGERVRPAVEGGVDRSLDLLFKVLDKVVNAAIKAVVAAVGSIPFVGGALAAVAAGAGEAIYNAVKKLVTNSVRKVGSRVCNRLIEGMSAHLVASISSNKNAKDDAIIAAVKAAIADSNRHLDVAGAHYEQHANAAKAEGYNLAAESATAARKLSGESEAEHKAIANGEVEACGAVPVGVMAFPAPPPPLVIPERKAPSIPALTQVGSPAPAVASIPAPAIASTNAPERLPWKGVGGRLRQLSVGGANHVWGVAADDKVFRWTGGGWDEVGGALRNVAVGADGTVWGVTGAGAVFRRDGQAWTNLPGALKQLSVGSARHVWGVTHKDEIYRWTGAGWERIEGALSNIAVGADGTVWGATGAGAIFRRDGSGWTNIGGALKQLAVGNARNVWGVTGAGELFRWNGAGWDKVDGALRWVGIGQDGTVWGVNGQDEIWHK